MSNIAAIVVMIEMERPRPRGLYCRSYKKTGCLIFLVVFFLPWVVYFKYTEDSIVGNKGTGITSAFAAIVKALTNPDNLVSEDEHIEQEIQDRVARYQDVCAVRRSPVTSSNKVIFFKNPGRNRSLSYCKVPKTGCTFWKRIYQFLQRSNTVANVSSPFNITRFQAQHSQMHMVRYNADYMEKALRFFFVRDPYTRLMSAYIDKFLLPQFLTWDRFGKIVAEYRNINMTKKVHKCINTVITFREFVEQIVLSDHGDFHWKPMNSVCDPCKLFPHVIGKQETFSRDVRYILSAVGLQDLMPDVSHKSYVADEIKQVVDFTYNYQYMKECLDNVDIASRLWKAFQMNGYLPSSMVFPKRQVETLLTQVKSKSTANDIVSNFIIGENTRALISRDEHSKLKKDMMLKEFGTLSKGTMEKLADMYETDFRMFGYDRYPRDIFPWRYRMGER